MLAGPFAMSQSDPFADVPKPLAEAMRARGFTALTAVQQAALAPGHEGRNLRISSVTGSGKTIALGLVLAQVLLAGGSDQRRGPEVLIIAPTRELAMQVRGELAWLYADVRSVEVEVVTGGVDIRGDFRRLSRRPRILVATPGRLLDHMRSGSVDPSDVAHVVLDEADQMLDMGFRDELEAIVAELPSARASHLVSATFPREVRELADRFQDDPVSLQGTAAGEANQDIEHTVYVVRDNNFYAALVNLLLLAQGRRCLVFVQRRVDAAELSAKLAGDGFSALPFSGDLSQAQRTRTLEAFRHGIVNTLISTDVAARGIDVADIATVIHADMPGDAANYTHRSGRTGRAGHKGTSLMLVPPKAQRYVKSLLRRANVDATWGTVPTPAKVRKAIRKRTRRQLHALLDAVGESEGEASISEGDRDYAEKLLAERDPVTLVATLLGMAMPTLPREPMEPEPEPEQSRDRARPRARDREDRGVPGRERPRRHGAADGFVRFQINWGQRGGATPGRLLAHLCRRGNITSREVGAVDIGRSTSTFEVSRQVADAFAQAVAKPDRRDPKLRIERA